MTRYVFKFALDLDTMGRREAVRWVWNARPLSSDEEQGQ